MRSPLWGRNPCPRNFTTEWLSEKLKNRNAPVKALLLEQSIAAGLGNLYVDESPLSRRHSSRPGRGHPVP